MCFPEIIHSPSGIEYQKVPKEFWEKDELVLHFLYGVPFKKGFLISDWLRDELYGVCDLTEKVFGKEVGFALMKSKAGELYQSHTEVGEQHKVQVPADELDYNNPNFLLKPLFLLHTHIKIGERRFAAEGFSNGKFGGDWSMISWLSRVLGYPYYGVVRQSGLLWVARAFPEKLKMIAENYILSRGLPIQPGDDPVQFYIYEIAKSGLQLDCSYEKTKAQRTAANLQLAQLRGADLYTVDLRTRRGKQVV